MLYTLNLYSDVCQLLLSKTGKIFKKHKRINRSKPRKIKGVVSAESGLIEKNSYIHWVFYCCCLLAKSCLIFCNPMDCSPLDSSVHGISQARILKWVAISFFRGSSRHRNWTRVSCTAGGFFFTNWTTREALHWIITHFLLSHHLPRDVKADIFVSYHFSS